MKKTVTVYVARRNGAEFTLVKIDETEGKAVLKGSDEKLHLVSLSTLKKTYKKVEKEVEQPSTFSKHQKVAKRNAINAYNWIVGGYENSQLDDPDAEIPSAEELFEEVYEEAMSTSYTGESAGGPAPAAVRFAVRQFVREVLYKKFKKDGYELNPEIITPPTKRQGASNYDDHGNRKNIKGNPDHIGDDEVLIKAFTGMVIGVVPIKEVTDTIIKVEAKNGVMEFDRASGKQINAKNPRFANKMEEG